MNEYLDLNGCVPAHGFYRYQSGGRMLREPYDEHLEPSKGLSSLAARLRIARINETKQRATNSTPTQ